MESIPTKEVDGLDQQEPVSGRQPQSKVKNACQRCRRQKLKCDIQRPCTLCVRAGCECIITKRIQFKAHQPKQHRQRFAVAENSRRSALPTYKTPRTNDRADTRRRSISISSLASSKQTEDIAAQEENTLQSGQADSNHDSILKEPLWNSSSTMVLVEKAFQYHETKAPVDQTLSKAAVNMHSDLNVLKTSDMGISQAEPRWDESGSPDNPSYMVPFPSKDVSPDATTLLSLLPSQEATALLVDTYFDRVHWFTLVFHQENFRSRVQQLYERSESQSRGIGEAFPFVSTLLTVIAISSQYLGEYRIGLLARFMIDPHNLRNRILTTLRSRILDIVSSGSLEAVQTCILLGSYYLYHGKPSLAIPIFGCGLRVAQALGLHRVAPRPDMNTECLNPAFHQRVEARKRCWWAIYEIDTFCSMLYGYPRSISDEDCNVDLLDPSAKLPERNIIRLSRISPPPQTTLLSYKYFMAKLSIIIKTTLTDLYGIRQNLPRCHRTSSDRNGRLQTLIKRVSDLDKSLQEWHAELPQKLQIRAYKGNSIDPTLVTSLDRDIGAGGEIFESHIFRLQALALKLAYENTRILIHRQLLSFRMDPAGSSTGLPKADHKLPTKIDPVQSLQTCWDAALQTAALGSTSVFHEAFDSYAVAFIGIHLFTAGVTLCITTSLNPMSIESQESKIGIHKLMEMEASLKPKSALAAQGLDILQKLTKLILAKELEKMLNFSSSSMNKNSRLDQNSPARESSQGQAWPDHETAEPAQTTQTSLSAGLTTETPSARLNPEASSVLPEIDNDLGLSYLEDTVMAEAFLDFDRVVSQCVRNQPNDEIDPAHADDFFQFDNGFADQEQAWIWGTDTFPFD